MKPNVQREKAELAFELNRIVKTVPPSVVEASIPETKAWLATQSRCMRVFANPRASRFELLCALVAMREHMARIDALAREGLAA